LGRDRTWFRPLPPHERAHLSRTLRYPEYTLEDVDKGLSEEMAEIGSPITKW
jgi:hypothetical protein